MIVGAVAGASGGDDGAASHQYTQEQAEAATKAALEATGGGTANSVESDTENGATYEVEVTKTDGVTVDVRLDEDYQVIVIESDSEDSGSRAGSGGRLLFGSALRLAGSAGRAAASSGGSPPPGSASVALMTRTGKLPIGMVRVSSSTE